MKKVKGFKGDVKIRQLITNEAARLMYQDCVSQYHTAKYMAARKVLSGGGKKISIKSPSYLPTNGEISAAVDTLVQLHEGDSGYVQLFSMRVIALEYLQQLEAFSPRLIGSVSTGRIKKTSDIDIHVFTDSMEELQNRMDVLGRLYETADVVVSQNSVLKVYTHVYIEHEYPIELSVYPKNEIRVRTRSSTDGKPIIRMTANKLLELIFNEHGDQWSRYIERGVE